MLEKIHEGHLGIEKSKQTALQHAYWPKMNGNIEEAVKK